MSRTWCNKNYINFDGSNNVYSIESGNLFLQFGAQYPIFLKPYWM